jgi:hypothetical protein
MMRTMRDDNEKGREEERGREMERNGRESGRGEGESESGRGKEGGEVLKGGKEKREGIELFSFSSSSHPRFFLFFLPVHSHPRFLISYLPSPSFHDTKMEKFSAFQTIYEFPFFNPETNHSFLCEAVLSDDALTEQVSSSMRVLVPADTLARKPKAIRDSLHYRVPVYFGEDMTDMARGDKLARACRRYSFLPFHPARYVLGCL